MTRNVVLVRQPSTDEGTFGSLLFGTSSLYTLELPWRNNAPQHSCIPVGSYKLQWSRSPKHGLCYHVLNVPNRSAILIHPANFAGDTEMGWQSELLGCIAPCLSTGILSNDHSKPQHAGISSRKALAIFETWAGTDELDLVIR